MNRISDSIYIYKQNIDGVRLLTLSSENKDNKIRGFNAATWDEHFPAARNPVVGFGRPISGDKPCLSFSLLNTSRWHGYDWFDFIFVIGVHTHYYSSDHCNVELSESGMGISISPLQTPTRLLWCTSFFRHKLIVFWAGVALARGGTEEVRAKEGEKKRLVCSVSTGNKKVVKIQRFHVNGIQPSHLWSWLPWQKAPFGEKQPLLPRYAWIYHGHFFGLSLLFFTGSKLCHYQSNYIFCHKVWSLICNFYMS